MTETEIAKRLGVDQSTISRDIKELKKMSQQFVYDLAKSDPRWFPPDIALSGGGSVRKDFEPGLA